MTKTLRLDELDLPVTDRCNARCVHCSYEAAAVGPCRDLSVRLAFDLIRQAARASCSELHLMGGEALLRPRVFDIAAEGKSNGMTVRLQTSGRAVNDRIVVRIQDAGIDWVMISVDGSHSAINDAIRGRGSFAAAIRAAKVLLGKAKLRLNSVIMARNVDDVVHLFELGRRLNVDLHSFFYFLPIGCGRSHHEQVVEPDRCPAHTAFTGRQHGERDRRCDHASIRPICPFYKPHVATGRLDVPTSQTAPAGMTPAARGPLRADVANGRAHDTFGLGSDGVECSDDAATAGETNVRFHPLREEGGSSV